MMPSKFDMHLPQPTTDDMRPNFQYYDSAYPLNLNLSVTRSLVQEINEKLETTSNQLGSSESHPSTSTKMKNASKLVDNDKSKNINFSATHLQIGQWNKRAIHNMSIVIKFYFKKRKLAVEALDGSLKTKIESKFGDIAAIRFLNTNTSNEQVMEILVDAQPEFFRETNPRPKKHTEWVASQDFTDGQASLYRKHILRFSPGSLEKYKDKIVAADSFLETLTSQPFPAEENPRFDHNLSQISFQNPPHTHQYSPAFGFPTNSLPEQDLPHQISTILQHPIMQTGYPLVDELQISGLHQHAPNNFIDPTPNYCSVTPEPINYIGSELTTSSEYWMDQQHFSSQFSGFQAPYCQVASLPLPGGGIPNQGESIWGDAVFQDGYTYDRQARGYDRWN